MKTNKNFYDLSRLSEETGLSKEVIKSIIVDYDVPCVQIGENKEGAIIVDYDKFLKVFEKININLKIRTLNRRKKNRDNCRRWYKENCDSEKIKARERNNRRYNTFGNEISCENRRGNSGMKKRDYELTEEELERRNAKRNTRKDRSGKKKKGYSVLIWYSGKLNDLSTEEYEKIMGKEYKRQYACAVKGYLGKKKPYEHFIFDFDLEHMFRNKCHDSHGNVMKHWWKGEIRHWTVNDGIWK